MQFTAQYEPPQLPDLSWVSITSGEDGDVTISWQLYGFPPNSEHALHIHEYGDITDSEAGMSTGDHFNPTNGAHGCYPNTDRHAGDLIANLTTDEDGASTGSVSRDLVDLSGDNSALGRSIVIHESFDDCGPNNGNAGPRIMQGVLGTVMDEGNAASGPALNQSEILVAVIEGTEDYREITGTSYMRTENGRLEVYVELHGLPLATNPEHFFGFHVHEYGDIVASRDGMSTGGHFNPNGETHGLPTEDEQHRGDLGNVESDNYGHVLMWIVIPDHNVPLQDMVGLGLVLHRDDDEGESQAVNNGNAGARIAVGVLGVTNAEFPPPPEKQVVALMRPTAEMVGEVPDTTGNPSWVEITYYDSSYSTVSWELWGYPPRANLSLHIHEYGDITDDKAGMGTGDHYNPTGAEHGCYPDPNRHIGDLIEVLQTDVFGRSAGTVQRDLIHLSGDYSAVGRSIIIHLYQDDCGPNNGNAGPRISQGVLGISYGLENNEATGTDALGEDDVLMAVLHPTFDDQIATGQAYFTEDENGDLYVTVWLEGLLPTNNDRYMGWHIHEFGDLRDPQVTTGGHYNPTEVTHGLPEEAVHHAGDFGNVVVDSRRVPGYVADASSPRLFIFKDLSLRELPGLSIILHRDRDQGSIEAEANGNAGPRIAAGVIGHTGQSFPVPLTLGFELHYAIIFLVVCCLGIILKWKKDNPATKKVEPPSSKREAPKIVVTSETGGTYVPPSKTPYQKLN